MGWYLITNNTTAHITLFNHSCTRRTRQYTLKRPVFSYKSRYLPCLSQAYEQVNIIIECNAASSGGEEVYSGETLGAVHGVLAHVVVHLLVVVYILTFGY